MEVSVSLIYSNCRCRNAEQGFGRGGIDDRFHLKSQKETPLVPETDHSLRIAAAVTLCSPCDSLVQIPEKTSIKHPKLLTGVRLHKGDPSATSLLPQEPCFCQCSTRCRRSVPYLGPWRGRPLKTTNSALLNTYFVL